MCQEKDNDMKRPQVKKATFEKSHSTKEEHIENICKKDTVYIKTILGKTARKLRWGVVWWRFGGRAYCGPGLTEQNLIT